MTLLVGAEAAVSGGTADLINLVIDRGLTFSLAILFITLLITRRVKIVDPTELSALAQISERLKTIDDSLKEIERKVDR